MRQRRTPVDVEIEDGAIDVAALDHALDFGHRGRRTDDAIARVVQQALQVERHDGIVDDHQYLALRQVESGERRWRKPHALRASAAVRCVRLFSESCRFHESPIVEAADVARHTLPPVGNALAGPGADGAGPRLGSLLLGDRARSCPMPRCGSAAASSPRAARAAARS